MSGKKTIVVKIGTSSLTEKSGRLSPERLRALADENEMKIVVTHTNPERIRSDTAAVIREHQILGCPYVGIGMMPEKYIGSLDGLNAFLADFDEAARMLHENGLKLQYHNHFCEYEKFDGKLAIDMMAAKTDPELWGFILDVSPGVIIAVSRFGIRRS